jgi:RimJ/RimL family protein N-acetyltransferase
MIVKKVNLKGNFIRLNPLSESHARGLSLVGRDKEIWRYLPYGDLTTETKMLEHIRKMLFRADQGIDLPFVIINRSSDQPIGCTRYIDINKHHWNLEIGGTWLAIRYQRTKANTESKYLLLTHAFEEIGCLRVQFKTSHKNIRSQKALERIGAKKEGVLRSHMIMPNGEMRDSVIYSILPKEWPTIKQNLLEKLEKEYAE